MIYKSCWHCWELHDLVMIEGIEVLKITGNEESKYHYHIISFYIYVNVIYILYMYYTLDDIRL